MQIIQNIRDRGAAIVIVVISLSLIGFILMDSKGAGTKSAGSLASAVGTVNGEKIELGDFNNRVQQAELQQQQRTGQSVTGAEASQLKENVWQTVVAEQVFFAEAEKLGLTLTSKELSSILQSNDPSNPFLQDQSMKDANGQLDQAKAADAIRNIKKMTGDQLQQVSATYIEPLRLSSIAGKYSGLLNAGAYYPSWMKERDKGMSASFATIQLVNIPYNVISDSAVKVTDDDINKYVAKNKKLFKQEAGRKLAYISFSQAPTKEDSAKLMATVESLKPQFSADTNAKVFVGRQGSLIDFQDNFIPRSKIEGAFTDTLLKQPVGTVYGPYVDGGAYVLAKVVGTKELPDSVQARHILIATTDPQTRQPIMEPEAAKKLADSILAAIKGGASFDALALKYSADGSKDKGGDLGTFGYGTMVPEFNDFVFTKNVGALDVVQTQFGYHVINVVKQSNFKPAYKVAYVAKEILPSEKTITTASTNATKAAGQKNAAELIKYAAANGLGVTKAPAIIKENDYAVGAMQDARQIVKWAFDAEKGDISEPFNVDNQFVVAMVEKVSADGVQDAADARSGAEAIILKEKKAAIIKTKLGAKPTLESAAAAYGKTIEVKGADSSITMNAQIINEIGIESKLIGAAFYKGYTTAVSPAIEGTNGVYVLKVMSVQPKAPAAEEQTKQLFDAKQNGLRQQMGNWFQSLRDQATIKDKRSKFF